MLLQNVHLYNINVLLGLKEQEIPKSLKYKKYKYMDWSDSWGNPIQYVYK